MIFRLLTMQFAYFGGFLVGGAGLAIDGDPVAITGIAIMTASTAVTLYSNPTPSP